MMNIVVDANICAKYVCMERNKMDKDLLLWLYEQKDEIDAHLYGQGKYDRAEGTARAEYFAQLNLLDKIIRHIKNGNK